MNNNSNGKLILNKNSKFKLKIKRIIIIRIKKKKKIYNKSCLDKIWLIWWIWWDYLKIFLIKRICSCLSLLINILNKEVISLLEKKI